MPGGFAITEAQFSHVELVQNPEDVITLHQLKVPKGRIRQLGNGIDLDRFGPPDAAVRAAVRSELGIAPDALVVGAIGRLVVEKGYRELFAAWETLRTEHPDAVLVVVGPSQPDKADGLDQATLDAAEAIGVRFTGMRDDVERIYHALDVYALLSHREGFPRSAMEAAACGLPIVATDIRGCRQVVDHDRTGLLVPPRDPHALATEMLRFSPARTSLSGAGLGPAYAEVMDEAGEATDRTWIVCLQSRSAVRIADNMQVNILASPQSENSRVRAPHRVVDARE